MLNPLPLLHCFMFIFEELALVIETCTSDDFFKQINDQSLLIDISQRDGIVKL